MAHDHHIPHKLPEKRISRIFVYSIALNMAFVIVEAAAGFWLDSLALLTDAGHNLSDVAGLIISYYALWLAGKKATSIYTYGYQKATIIAALVNAVVLLVAVGAIGWEAVLRLMNPLPIQGNWLAAVAGVGIVINTLSALLFRREQELNARGAYLHLAADALVSLGVVVGGVIMFYTHWFWLDAIISIGIMIVILAGTWRLLLDAWRMTLMGVPRNVEIERIKDKLKEIPGVIDAYHIHVWALSTTENALTAHVTVGSDLSAAQADKLKDLIRHELCDLNIQHVTLETVAFGSPGDHSHP